MQNLPDSPEPGTCPDSPGRSREAPLRPTVLHVVSGDLWAGAEVMVYNLLRTLHEHARTRVLALALNQGTLAEKLKGAGVPTIVIPEREHSFVRVLWEAVRAYRRSGVDIIHTHRYKEHLLGFLLSRLLGGRSLVATVHGLPEPPGAGKRSSLLASLKARGTQRLLGKHFSWVVAVSREMKSALAGPLPGDRVVVIHNGIDLPPEPPRFAATTPERLLHVGTVGRMVPVKDFDLFLQIAERLKRSRTRLRFSILGDGPLQPALMKRAAALGIAADVAFLPPVADPLPFYRSLDIYLNTSHHEGMPLSILEAMACCRPVVAPRTGGIPEIIPTAGEGLLVDMRTPEAFEQALSRLIDDEALRRSIGRRGRERVVSCFSREEMANAYEALYGVGATTA